MAAFIANNRLASQECAAEQKKHRASNVERGLSLADGKQRFSRDHSPFDGYSHEPPHVPGGKEARRSLLELPRGIYPL
jgi:hypothetical protein